MEYKTELDKLRHSCSHVMAQAVKELWPETKIAIVGDCSGLPQLVQSAGGTRSQRPARQRKTSVVGEIQKTTFPKQRAEN